jgi:hypothetical protein
MQSPYRYESKLNCLSRKMPRKKEAQQLHDKGRDRLKSYLFLITFVNERLRWADRFCYGSFTLVNNLGNLNINDFGGEKIRMSDSFLGGLRKKIAGDAIALRFRGKASRAAGC